MAVLSSTAQFTSTPYNHQLSGLDTASSIKKEDKLCEGRADGVLQSQ